MNAQDQVHLVWREFEPVRIPASAFHEQIGLSLAKHYGAQVKVTFPSHLNGDCWEFVPQGWAGTFPIESFGCLTIRPKVPVANLFRLWAYADNLRAFKFLDGLTELGEEEDVCTSLAHVLIKGIQAQWHEGLYRTYVPRSERRTNLSGRLDVAKDANSPWRVDLPCEFRELTSDIPENQILTWTLYLLRRIELSNGDLKGRVNWCYRHLQTQTALLGQEGREWKRLTYHRLNESYEPLHALCRFFIDHLAPNHHGGSASMLPFQVDMAKLFEKFVANWLKANLPHDLELVEKEPIPYGPPGSKPFEPDIVIRYRASGLPLAVLDTKYKTTLNPDSTDIHQVRSHAEALGCTQVMLLYPQKRKPNAYGRLGSIHLHTLGFNLNGDLEQNGADFLNQMMGILGSSTNLPSSQAPVSLVHG